MSIDVKETFQARRSTQGKDWKRTYTRTWRAITNDPHVDACEVRESCPVAIGQTYAAGSRSDFGSFVQSITAECSDSDGKGWTITAEYGPYDANQWPQNPTERTPKVSWSFAQFEAIADQDVDGNPILNTAFDYFDPPVTKDDSRPILTIVRNEATFDENLAEDYKDTVNADAFWGKDAKTVKVSNISAEWAFDSDIGFYFIVTYEFHVNKDGWKKKPLNQGMRQLSSDGSKQQQILVNGAPISSPALLDEDGVVLAAGADPVYLEFEVYPAVDFGIFNMDALYSRVTS